MPSCVCASGAPTSPVGSKPACPLLASPWQQHALLCQKISPDPCRPTSPLPRSMQLRASSLHLIISYNRLRSMFTLQIHG